MNFMRYDLYIIKNVQRSRFIQRLYYQQVHCIDRICRTTLFSVASWLTPLIKLTLLCHMRKWAHHSQFKGLIVSAAGWSFGKFLHVASCGQPTGSHWVTEFNAPTKSQLSFSDPSINIISRLKDVTVFNFLYESSSNLKLSQVKSTFTG